MGRSNPLHMVDRLFTFCDFADPRYTVRRAVGLILLITNEYDSDKKITDCNCSGGIDAMSFLRFNVSDRIRACDTNAALRRKRQCEFFFCGQIHNM